MCCRVAKFSGVHMLTLHIPRNFGGDHTTVSFIGIKGEFSEVRCPCIWSSLRLWLAVRLPCPRGSKYRDAHMVSRATLRHPVPDF